MNSYPKTRIRSTTRRAKPASSYSATSLPEAESPLEIAPEIIKILNLLFDKPPKEGIVLSQVEDILQVNGNEALYYLEKLESLGDIISDTDDSDDPDEKYHLTPSGRKRVMEKIRKRN